MELPQLASSETESLPPPKINDGKDELNLAEFPLCSIADRLHPDQTTLTFEDRIWDANRGEVVTRQLTITASAQHGLPTALDDEVILGLIQLSKLQEFADRRITFRRYQLIQLLGWPTGARSYERLEKSLNRWVGVTLYYKNAWWNREQRCWADEKFHILDNVTLFDRDQLKQRQGSQSSLPLSSFVWNEVVFRSFRAGNLKGLDFEFFKCLKSSVAKRLYRFLDKRFWHRPRWEFDLKELAWEHIGLARSYDVAHLKRRLLPGIQELEEYGFVATMPSSERFKKISSGNWRIVFEKPIAKSKRELQAGAPGVSAEEMDFLVKGLIDRGITPFAAQEIAAKYPVERIKAQLEVFDWYVANADQRVSRNPAGFLISSIKGEYAPPKGFLSREERERRERKIAEKRRRAEEREKRAEEEKAAKDHARAVEIERFWETLSRQERARLEAEALDQAATLQRQLAGRKGSLGEAARKSILDGYALKMMQVEA